MTGKVPASMLDQTTDAAVPTGIMADFAGGTTPAGWLLCDGSAVSRTIYAALFAAIGTVWGAGDGSTTFNVPDLRGRACVGKDDMGGTAASRTNVTLTGTKASTSTGVITGLSSTTGLCVGMQAFGTGIGAGAVINSIDSATQVTLSVNSTATGSGTIRFGVIDGASLGAVGGSHIHTLTTPQMPAHTHAQTGQNGGTVSAGSFFTAGNYGSVSGQATASTGGGQAHPNMQPSAVVNKIIRT